MNDFKIYIISFLAVIAIFATQGCKKAADPCQPDSSYQPDVKPENFPSTINQYNQYFPLVIGRKMIYQGISDEGTEVVEITFSTETIKIMDITCVTVIDRVMLNNELIEETRAYYAQDKDGNVWIFGEDNRNFDDGKIINQLGSWIAGIDGALPGIYVSGNPIKGNSYRQGLLVCEYEDMAEDLASDENVTVSYGSYDQCLKTREWNSFEPGIDEFKYYAPGIGFILSTDKQGGNVFELIDIQ